MNDVYFTTMKTQVDLFLFDFWKKLKTPKRHFDINRPLVSTAFKFLPNFEGIQCPGP